MRAGIALGSNVGDRLGALTAARDRICGLRDVNPPVLTSAVYETAAVDCEPGAGKFLNAVIEVSHFGGPEELLAELRTIETTMGRPADHRRNTSRTIDLDLLYYGDEVMNTPELAIPHPRIAGRGFVLTPLADIRPELVLAGASRTVAEMLAQLRDGSAVVRFTSKW